MQKHANLVDIVKSFPTNIYLQNLASIQPRASPVKFARSLALQSTQLRSAGRGTIAASSARTQIKETRRAPVSPGAAQVIAAELPHRYTARSGKLYRARSRLYRSQILQGNIPSESSRRDLHNALLCTVLMESRLVLESQFGQNLRIVC